MQNLMRGSLEYQNYMLLLLQLSDEFSYLKMQP